MDLMGRWDVAKVTVYLPDGLYERFQRHRAKIHLSTLFQAALASELDLLESTSGEGTVSIDDEATTLVNQEDFIMRLKREKAQAEAEWFERGVHDGIAWARDTHYTEIRRWGEAQLADLIPPRRADAVPQIMADFVADYYMEPSWDYEGFARGWLSGVRKVLKLVQTKINQM
jgi:hypothetical protein